jgi:hypothetical protein
MAALESRLVIAATDDTAAAFAAVEARIRQLQGSLAGLNTAVSSVGRASSNVPMVQPTRPAPERKEAEPTGVGAVNTLLGAAAVITGIDALKGGYEQAAAQAHEKIRQQVAGMTQEQIAGGEKLAFGLAQKYPSVAQSDIMHTMRNATTAIGDFDEAKGLMEPLTRLRVIAQSARPHAPPEEITEDFDKLVKSMEIAGATKSPELFQSYMKGIAKSLNAFGDQMKPSDYFEMLKYSRQAASKLSERFLVTTMTTLGSEIGGASIGTAVASFNRAMVGGHMEHQAAVEMAGLGLFKETDLTRLKTGEVKGVKRGSHVEGWQLAQSDPDLWIEKYLMPALQTHGFKSSDDVAAEVSKLFPNRTAGQFVSEVTTQQQKLAKNAENWRKAMSDEAADTIGKGDINAAMTGAYARVKNFIASQVPIDALGAGARAAGSAFGFLTPGPGAPSISDLGHDAKEDLHGWADFFKSIHVGAPTYEKWGAPAARAAAEDAGERARMLSFAHPAAAGAAPPQSVDVHGEATVTVPVQVTVTASSELLRVIEDAKNAAKTAKAQMALNPVQGGHAGRMNSDAAPVPHGTERF